MRFYIERVNFMEKCTFSYTESIAKEKWLQETIRLDALSLQCPYKTLASTCNSHDCTFRRRSLAQIWLNQYIVKRKPQMLQLHWFS